jgi:hypothetical protein
MTNGFAWPTIFFGAGKFGRRVIEFVDESLGESNPLLASFSCSNEELGTALPGVLERLLRAGRAPSDLPGARLDIVAFISAEESELVSTCTAFAKTLADRYAVVFPIDAAPAQRMARLQLVVKLPALSTPAAAVALRRVEDLEAWAQGQPEHPLLSRIWLVGRQTTSGNLSEQEVVAASGGFALAALASGVRTDDLVQERMAFPLQEGLVSLLAASCRDLPVASLCGYAAERAAYDAVDRMVSRIAQPANDPLEADGTVHALDAAGWLRPFETGEPAQSCKKLTAKLSGIEKSWPEVRVGALQSPEKIRAQHAEFFAPATQEHNASAMEGGELEQVLKTLDRAEWEALAGLQQRLDALLEKELAPLEGLARLPKIELGLRRLRDGLVDEQRHETLAAPESVQPDPGRGELEAVYRKLPRPAVVWASSLAAGVAIGAAALSTILFFQAPASAVQAAALSAPIVAAATAPAQQTAFDWTLLAPWLVGGLAMAISAFGWAWMVGQLSRADLRLVLAQRKTELENLRVQGGAGWGRTQGDHQLRLRKRRLRLGAHRAIEHALTHLQAVRRQLIESRDLLRQRVLARQVLMGADAARDDLAGLLGTAEPLHAPLINTEALARWIATCRETAEADIWASRLLERSWQATGILDDVPCANIDQLVELGRAETASIRARSLFDDPGAAAATTRSMQELVASASALAPICKPRNHTDDPIQGLRGGEMIAFVSEPARDAVERAARDAGLNLKVVKTSSSSQRAIILRTWEGLTAQDVSRGSARRPTSPGAGAASP